MKEFAEEKSIKEAECLDEDEKPSKIVSKKMLDAIIKAGKNGGKIVSADGDGFVT